MQLNTKKNSIHSCGVGLASNKKSNLYYTRGITLKRVISGGALLRGSALSNTATKSES